MMNNPAINIIVHRTGHADGLTGFIVRMNGMAAKEQGLCNCPNDQPNESYVIELEKAPLHPAKLPDLLHGIHRGDIWLFSES